MRFFDKLKKLKDKVDERNSQLLGNMLSATNLDKNDMVSSVRSGMSAFKNPMSVLSDAGKSSAKNTPAIPVRQPDVRLDRPANPINSRSSEELTEEEMEEILRKFAEFEARIAKLERAIGGGSVKASNSSAVTQSRDHIVAQNGIFFKTAKGRTLIEGEELDSNDIECLRKALISIGDNMEPDDDDDFEAFAVKVRAKYNPDQLFPTLLGAVILNPDGEIYRVEITNRKVNF